ncbi:Protein kinase-like protein [Gracilaria domingensis]|nr:Protein kinase-like protein [Gracilaria domingensis]
MDSISQIYQKGERFDQYVIERLISSEYIQMIYCAYDTVRETNVLLTIEKHDKFQKASDFSKIFRQKFGGDGLPIVKVLQVGEFNGSQFAVQEYHGPLASELVKDGEKITREKATTICLLILDAVRKIREKCLYIQRIGLEHIMLTENVDNNSPAWSAVHIANVPVIGAAKGDRPGDHQHMLNDLLQIYFTLWFEYSGNVRPSFPPVAEKFPEFKKLFTYISRLAPEIGGGYIPDYDLVRELILGRTVDPSLFPPAREQENRLNALDSSRKELLRWNISLMGICLVDFELSVKGRRTL